MELRIYKENAGTFPAVIAVVYEAGYTPPIGFVRVTNIEEMLTDVFTWGSSLDYKIIRDAAKQ